MRFLLPALLILTGCKPGSYIITGNDVNKEKGVLYYKNNDSAAGVISVELETFSHANTVYRSYIDFMAEGKSVPDQVPLNDISGYRIGQDVYVLKRVDIRMDGTYHLLFLRRLTPAASRIHLYELHESGKGNDGTFTASGESIYSYYLSLPGSGPLEAVNTRSSVLLPLFDEKMSKMVADCTPLAAKIKAKEKGYFIPFMTFATKRHPDVLMRIIREYNNCR